MSIHSTTARLALILAATTTGASAQVLASAEPEPTSGLRSMFQPASPLFRARSVTRPGESPEILRQRMVQLAPALLGVDDQAHPEPVDRVALNLFEDVTLTGVYEGDTAAYGGGWIRTFGIEEDPHGHAYFSMVGGACSVVVRAFDRLYKVQTIAPGRHRLVEIDERALPSCGTEPRGPSIQPGSQELDDRVAGPRNHDQTVDLMVAYTLDAEAANGGASGVTAMINLGLYETNLGLSQSDVALRMNLVHVVLTPYVEVGAGSVTHTERLQDPSDGFMDELHVLRDQYGADIVSLIHSVGGYCGYAYDILCSLSTSFEDSAFCVVKDTCLTGNYTLAHELGHLLGAQHDRAHTSGCFVTTSCYGWRTPVGQYRTIMAYPPGTTVNFWSNPTKLAPGGEPLGVPGSEENQFTLNLTASTVSAFRPAKDLGHSVTTRFAANGGHAGAMFDIEPKSDITLTSFAINTNTPARFPVTIDVWYRIGSFQGHDSSSAGWIRLGAGTGVSTGNNNPTVVPVPNNQTFLAGQVYGMYVDMTSYVGTTHTLRNTTAPGPVRYEDNHLKITTGIAKGPGFGGTSVFWREWNGTLSYQGANGHHSLATTFLGINGFGGVMFQVDAARTLTINSFDVNVDAAADPGVVTVDVWLKAGGYAGFETSPGAWTYVGSDSKAVGAGNNIPTRIAVGNLTLGSRNSYSFYLHLASHSAGHILRYGNGTPTYANADLAILPGIGRSEQAFTGGVFPGRYFEGAIHYSLAPWTLLGNSLPATAGPLLTGAGSVLPGQAVTLSLTGAPSSRPAFLIVGLNAVYLPWKGGTLVPDFDALFAFPTDSLGKILLPGTWPTNLPQGIGAYFQYWIPDAAMPQGMRASNALLATTQ